MIAFIRRAYASVKASKLPHAIWRVEHHAKERMQAIARTRMRSIFLTGDALADGALDSKALPAAVSRTRREGRAIQTFQKWRGKLSPRVHRGRRGKRLTFTKVGLKISAQAQPLLYLRRLATTSLVRSLTTRKRKKFNLYLLSRCSCLSPSTKLCSKDSAMFSWHAYITSTF